MADRSAARLARLHRVRSLQLDLVRADEARAAQRVASETALRDRIDGLARSVAPVESPAPSSAVSFIAQAHYRERLNQSAVAAASRVQTAENGLSHARERTLAAQRDRTAIEKLIERAKSDAVRAEMRALENQPGEVRKKRHDPC